MGSSSVILRGVRTCGTSGTNGVQLGEGLAVSVSGVEEGVVEKESGWERDAERIRFET